MPVARPAGAGGLVGWTDLLILHDPAQGKRRSAYRAGRDAQRRHRRQSNVCKKSENTYLYVLTNATRLLYSRQFRDHGGSGGVTCYGWPLMPERTLRLRFCPHISWRRDVTERSLRVLSAPVCAGRPTRSGRGAPSMVLPNPACHEDNRWRKGRPRHRTQGVTDPGVCFLPYAQGTRRGTTWLACVSVPRSRGAGSLLSQRHAGLPHESRGPPLIVVC
jgi:hypothetical protein